MNLPGHGWRISVALVLLVTGTSAAIGEGGARCPLRAEFVSAPVGHSERALRKAYGVPTGGQDFLLGRGLNASRRSLRSLYPGARFDRLRIRELGWARGDCRLVAWLVQKSGRWVVVQALRSNLEGEF